MPHMAQKPAFLEFLMIFYYKKLLMRICEGCRKLFVGFRVAWKSNNLKNNNKKNGLEMPPMAQKPAFLTYFMIFILKKKETKNIYIF